MTTAWNEDRVWPQQIGGLTGIVGRVPSHKTLKREPFVNSQAARCTTSSSRYPACPRKCVAGEGSSSADRLHEQELLWRQFFLDPLLWRDNRRDKKGCRSPHFRRKASGEVLWLNNLHKPAWVDEQLAALDMQMGRGSPTSKPSSLPYMPDPGKPAGAEMGLAAVSMRTTCQQGELHETVEGRARDGSACEGARQEEQEVLWRQFFRDPTLWWDNRRDRKSPRSPDFRRKGSGEALWLNNKDKPSWVDEQLVVLDIQIGRGGPTTQSSLREKPDRSGPAGYETGVTAGTVSTLCQQGKLRESVGALEVLARTDCPIAKSLFYTVLKQCVAKDLVLGRRVHALIVKRGYGSDTLLSNHILRMYASHARLQDAIDVFTLVAKPDAFTWCAIISAHVEHGHAKQAIQLYHRMRRSSVKPSGHVFVAALRACARGADFETGQQVHADVLASGVEPHLFVVTCLVDMYAKCGSLKEAQSLFDRLPQKDVVTWNTMISGYSQQGMGREALYLYTAMQEEGISTPNSVTFACLLQACASLGTMALENGKQLHAQIGRRRLEGDVVLGCSLVNMYAKCGSLEDAQSVFDRLPHKDVVTWNAMIAGYSQQGMGQEALHLYSVMQKEGITTPNSVTFVCLLHACALVAALPVGKQLHRQIEERRLQGDLVVGSSLVNMYAKCGSMVDAQQVFDAFPERDIAAWGALIAGYSRQGDSDLVFALVQRMTEDGIQPDSSTLLCVLTVCSHAGLVNKGYEYLEAMSREYGITRTVEHYTCMVDLLSRAGQLDEALEVVRTMPVEPTNVVWSTLLGACRKWSNVEVGRHAFDEAVKLDEKDSAVYAMMSNIYTGAQMWEEAQEIQVRRKEIGAWKKPGQSWWTDSSGRVHSFLVGDKKHPESEGVYTRLEEQLVPKRQKEGYVPHLDSSLRDTSDFEKEAHLCRHSEKLAMAYALNKTPEATTIYV